MLTGDVLPAAPNFKNAQTSTPVIGTLFPDTGSLPLQALEYSFDWFFDWTNSNFLFDVDNIILRLVCIDRVWQDCQYCWLFRCRVPLHWSILLLLASNFEEKHIELTWLFNLGRPSLSFAIWSPICGNFVFDCSEGNTALIDSLIGPTVTFYLMSII